MEVEQRVTHIEHALNSQDQRLQALERAQRSVITDQAVRQERDKHLDLRFDRLEHGVNEVKGYLMKIVWVIVLGIVGSLITFMVQGGFNVAP